MKILNWKYISVAVFIGLYSYIISLGFVTVGACEGTPTHELTVGFVLMALFPFFLGLLLYILFSHNKLFNFKVLKKMVAIAACWLALAFILWFATMLIIWNYIEHNQIIIPHISQFGCYNEIEPTPLAFHFTWLIICFITGLAVCLMLKKKSIKYDKLRCKKYLILITISFVIGLFQTIFCKTLYYGIIDVLEIPTKRDLAMGLGLWYWWRFQLVIAIVSCFCSLLAKKRFAQITFLCSQTLLFIWYHPWSIYPYRISFLFGITLCSIILVHLMCCSIRQKYMHINKKQPNEI